jgi:chromosome segregation ATPase
MIHLAGNLSATDRVIHEADHLAEVEQWQRIIVTHVDVIAEKDMEIAQLKEQLYNNAGNADVERADLRGEIATLTARIKELEDKAALGGNG